MIRAGEEVDDANVVRLRRFAMSHLKSPVDAHSAEPVAATKSATKKVAFKQLKLLLLPVLRWAKGLIDAQKLPHLADKACEVYLGEADRAHQDKCRQLLRTRLELNPVQLQRFFHTSVGDTLITWFGRFFHLPLGEDNQHTLKALLLQMAAEPDGLSLLSFLRRFPEPIQLNIDQLLFTAKRVELLLKETDAAIAIIAHCAIAESIPSAEPVPSAESAPGPSPSVYADIRMPGPWAIARSHWVVEPGPVQSLSETESAQGIARSLQVFCYHPQPLPPGKIPVVVYSHGLASNPDDLAGYAQHLASYGYCVAVPQHPGSDAEHVRNMLAGRSQELFKLTEFVDRPRDISHLLDDLERRNATEFGGHLDLTSVGVMGYSFGAYTAFALAGADIHFERLEMACGTTLDNPNISLLLQCQALGLPRQTYNLHDARVRAILSMDSVGSEVLGQQGIEKIQIPVLLIAGSQDTTAPLSLEQIRIFQWLTTPHRYLALMRGKAHSQDIQRLVNSLELHIKVSSQPTPAASATPFEDYIQALSLAFFNQHLANPPQTSVPPLSAAYGATLSQSPFDLWLISQASSESLTQALQALDLSLQAQVHQGR